MVGDFNATSPTWFFQDVYNAAGRLLEPVFNQLGLFQCVDFDSHLGNDGRLQSLLDLVLVSHRNMHVKTSALPPLGKFDHVTLESTLSVRASSACPASRPHRIWLYDQADFEKINSVLSGLDWSEVSTAPDINKA